VRSCLFLGPRLVSKIESKLYADIKAAIDADIKAGTRDAPVFTNMEQAQRALVEHWLDLGLAPHIVQAFERWESEEMARQKATPSEWLAAARAARAGDPEATPRDITRHARKGTLVPNPAEPELTFEEWSSRQRELQ